MCTEPRGECSANRVSCWSPFQLRRTPESGRSYRWVHRNRPFTRSISNCDAHISNPGNRYSKAANAAQPGNSRSWIFTGEICMSKGVPKKGAPDLLGWGCGATAGCDRGLLWCSGSGWRLRRSARGSTNGMFFCYPRSRWTIRVPWATKRALKLYVTRCGNEKLKNLHWKLVVSGSEFHGKTTWKGKKTSEIRQRCWTVPLLVIFF